MNNYKSPSIYIKEMNDCWLIFWHLWNFIFSFIEFLLVLEYLGHINSTRSTSVFYRFSNVLYWMTLNSNNWLKVDPIPSYRSHRTISSTLTKVFYMDKKTFSSLFIVILILFDFKTISIVLASYWNHWNSFCSLPQILFFTTLTKEKIMHDF